MKKIFTLICGLILSSAFVANAQDEATVVPDSIYVYVCQYDYDKEQYFEIADPFETTLTKDEEGNYVITNFFNSQYPVKFTFEQPKVKKTTEISFKGFLEKGRY